MPNEPSERRLHPVSFAFELASHVRQLLVPGLVVLIAGARGSESWQAYGMLLIVPVALVAIARALVFRYTLAADGLAMRSGLLFRQQRHIPYPRIQNLDAIQTIFHRALNVVDVRIETAGGEEPEAHLKVVSLGAFEEIRDRIAAGRAQARGAQGLVPREAAAGVQEEPQAASRQDGGGQVPSAAAPGVPPTATTLLQLTTRDLVICGLIQGRGLLVLGALFGVLWEAGLLDRIFGGMVGGALEGPGAARQVARAVFGRGVPPFGRILLAGAGFAAFLLVTRVFSVGWALVRLHGFRLLKSGDDVRADFGLLTRVAATVPIRRIQAVSIHEGPLHRLFGRVSIHVDTAGGGSGEAVQLQRQWLAPVVRREDAPELIRAIVPAAAPPEVDWQPVDPRGLRRARVRWLLTVSVISLALSGPLRWWTAVAFLALALAGELHVRRWVRALQWGLTDAAVLFRSGWIWRRQTAAPFSKVQVVSIRESPFDRRLGMARVAVDTAGLGRDGHRIDVPYLSRPVAEALEGRLAGAAARTTFRW